MEPEITERVFEGSNYFRQRLVLSTLTGVPIKIRDIRNGGIKGYEQNLLSLLMKMCTGMRFKLDKSGTVLSYYPGALHGGAVEHNCNKERSIGYYLEVLLCLAPFCKESLNCKLHGVTNNGTDPSADFYQYTAFSFMKDFLGIDEDDTYDDNTFIVKVLRRSLPPSMKGEVLFKCPVVKKLRPVQFLEEGKVGKIRGVVSAFRVPTHVSKRVAQAASRFLKRFVNNVIVEESKCVVDKETRGLAITLYAQTTSGRYYCVDRIMSEAESGMPEDLGEKAASDLLEEVYSGGCVSSANQSILAVLMASVDSDVSQVRVGSLTQYAISVLRLIKEFYGMEFLLEHIPSSEDVGSRIGGDRVLMTCVGAGFANMNRRLR